MLTESLLNQIIRPPASRQPVLDEVCIRSEPEDFQVEEIPAYLPDGCGEHLYLWMEKRDLSAGEFLSRLARSFGVKSGDIGTAGQKDKRAVTRLFVSVPRTAADSVQAASLEDMAVLSVSAHTNKLRTGHLRGNRFDIRLRHPDGLSWDRTHADAVSDSLADICRRGFPNYFGPQRFGRGGSTIRDGLAILKPESNDRKRRRSRTMKRLAVSAVQSAVFNLVLADRVAAETFGCPQSGDVVCRRDGRRPFLFDDRGDTPDSELVPMGPMPGPNAVPAHGAAQKSEQEAMAALTLEISDFEAAGKLASGTRRKLVVFPSEADAGLLPDGRLQLRFVLPAGSFATVLLAELCGSPGGNR